MPSRWLMNGFWMVLAFVLGLILGAAGLLALLIIVQAMISYPG